MKDVVPSVRTVMVTATELVFPTVHALLERYPNCECIEVGIPGTQLFQIDRTGATTPAPPVAERPRDECVCDGA